MKSGIENAIKAAKDSGMRVSKVKIKIKLEGRKTNRKSGRR